MNTKKINFTGKVYKISFWAVILLALTARIYHLDSESLFMDELRQVSYYNNNFFEIIKLAASQQQPPLDYWIGHIVYYFNQSDFAVRLPAAMFGVGSVIFLMLLIARISGRGSAIVAGTLMSLLPFHLYFSQEARPYSIAIFFFVFMLWMLARILETAKHSIRQYVTLLSITCGFLFSRTLSPLLTVSTLIIILFIQSIVPIKQEKPNNKEFFPAVQPQRKRCIIIFILCLAILIYLPNLLLILKTGQRYAPHAGQFGLNVFSQGIENFSLIPMWQAYLVQLEPLGYSYFILSALSILFVVILPRWRQNPLLSIVIFLLPLTAILHTFVFLAKTSLPLRPPYAIYIMPLALIGGTHVILELKQRMSPYSAKIILWGLLLPLTFGSLLYSDIFFYSTPKKTDWKGLTQYLEQHTSKNHLLLSDTFVVHPNFPQRAWEPNFYGFSRYYHGQAGGIELYQLPTIKKELLFSTLQPVLIIFEWHPYNLTPFSPYPIMQKGGSQPDFSVLADNPAINLKHFTGFSVLQLSETVSHGNLATNTLILLNEIRPLLFNNPSSNDIIRVTSYLENM